MSKQAEDAALKAYPVIIEEHTERDLNKPRRLSYIKGYEQALSDIKDLIDSNVSAGYASKIIRLIEQNYE